MARHEKKTRQPHPDPMADKYLECGDCMERMSAAARASWRCGWMSPEERTCPGFKGQLSPKWGHTPEDVCPGYLITIPQVCEASRAHWWMEKGQLGERYPEQSPLLHECIDIIASANGEVEQELLTK